MQSETSKITTHYQSDTFTREWGYKGLGYDNTPNMDINNRLFALSRGLQSLAASGTDLSNPFSSTSKPVEINHSTTASVQTRILQNRAWKLLLVGLCQADAYGRYETMNDIARAIPSMLDNLHDSVARDEILEMLVTLSLSDERFENRVKAVYLLGQVAAFLGVAEDCHELLSKVFSLGYAGSDFITFVLSRFLNI